MEPDVPEVAQPVEKENKAVTMATKKVRVSRAFQGLVQLSPSNFRTCILHTRALVLCCVQVYIIYYSKSMQKHVSRMYAGQGLDPKLHQLCSSSF